MEASEGAPLATSDTDALVKQWTTAQARFHRLTSQLTDEVTRRTGLPASSVQALLFLLHSPPYHSVPMTQLAHHLEFSTAGTTKVTDRLAQAGLIERHPCTVDRRVVRATLTAEGLIVARQTADALAFALKGEVISRIGQEGLAQLVDLVAIMAPSD